MITNTFHNNQCSFFNKKIHNKTSKNKYQLKFEYFLKISKPRYNRTWNNPLENNDHCSFRVSQFFIFLNLQVVGIRGLL